MAAGLDFDTMVSAQATYPVRRAFRLMSPRSAKRWGRWFAFTWMFMWVSTALLPCCEVAAAIAAHEQAVYTACEHAGGAAPDSNGDNKRTPCFSIAVPASVERPAAAGAGDLTPQALQDFAPFHVVLPQPALSRPVDHPAAPPPVAVYLRSLRLLI